jgi:predicted PurR-regulated permease PerM
MSNNESSPGTVRVSAVELPSLSGLLTLAAAVVVVAALYLARDLLVPITLAVLLSFALAPFVRVLRWAGLPRPPAALIAVILALAVILAVGGVIGAQIASLTQDLPRYETTIRQKVDAVRAVTIGRLTRFLERIDELRASGAGSEPARSRAGTQQSPRTPTQPTPNATAGGNSGNTGTAASSAASPLAMLGSILSPVLSPIATLGIVLVITLFILLQQDDLRDRFIRLVGGRDLHRTTMALDEAVRRLSKYFLVQLVINSAFGVVIAIGLYVIGLPSPALWGVVAGIFRFIPYAGAWIAAALPLIVAVAVDPGWSMFAWTLALFVVAEPIMGQVIEPLVYGHTTGLTPVSVVIATIFWTWLWGPIGLILATPLTLCLVVLGRHVDRLKFLDVLLGDRPALSPTESFYQRMLAGDPDEVQDQAELLLRTRSLSAYYDDIALSGLKLAADDALRGVLNTPQLLRIRDSVQELIDELEEYGDTQPALPNTVEKLLASAEQPDSPAPAPGGHSPQPVLHSPHGLNAGAVLCVAGTGPLDDSAASMLAQLLSKHGLSAKRIESDPSARAAIAALDPSGIAMVCLSVIEPTGNVGRLRLLVRRLRRRLPKVPILLGFWLSDQPSVEYESLCATIGADDWAGTLAAAVTRCLDIAATTAPTRTT